MTGFQEYLLLALLIIVLSATGLWPKVIQGLRELRGERFDDEVPRSDVSKGDTDVFFRLLGISPSASWEEIERAYRQKAKVHHPDRGGDEDAMRTLNEVYAQLKRIKGRR